MQKIFENKGDIIFYRISNADGKVWLMPKQHLATAMCLYQPSGWKGKLFKKWFPVLHKLAFARKALHISQEYISLYPKLRTLLCSLFFDDVEFAAFLGTPCVHQKVTIQIFHGKKILGYCKVSQNKDIAALFAHEDAILAELKVKGIPTILSRGEYDGFHFMIQTTEKTLYSKPHHSWGELEGNFLKQLQANNSRTLPFEETDFYNDLVYLREHLQEFNITQRDTIASALTAAFTEYANRNVCFSPYHADFTPWNMFVEDGKLFVFDWEYARLTYPAGLDRYHFFTQVAYFEHHATAADIIDYCETTKAAWIDRSQYRNYLLSIISIYLQRENGKPENFSTQLSFWCEILSWLCTIK